jgi:transcriptional regulator
MHPNPIYRAATEIENLEFVRSQSFGTLAINNEDGPLLSHIPFILSDDGHRVYAHLVRSNPIARAVQAPTKAVLSIIGPHGYISPDWYQLDDQVPTWNYVAVHLRGELQVLPEDQLLPHLAELSALFERRLLPKPPWTTDKVSDPTLAKFLRMIVPIKIDIQTVNGTWKLNQNKPAQSITSAAEAVAESEIGIEPKKLSALMKAELERNAKP